jgi:cell division protein FtsL
MVDVELAMQAAPEKKPSKITEGTLLPISMVILVMVGVIWITRVHVQTTQNTHEIQEIQRRWDDQGKTINQIAADVSEIKGYLKGKNE